MSRGRKGPGTKHSGTKQRFAREAGRAAKEREDIAKLEEAIRAGAPEPGTNPLSSDVKQARTAVGGKKSQSQPTKTTYAGARLFAEIPLSENTRNGLKKNKFTNMIAIQRATLPHAICGRDVLGAAKTGSGKTFAFLVPMLEKLYRAQWTTADGLGGLVISPTRELALQIFEQLRKIGTAHGFSAGLVIGGKDVHAEQEHILGMNILICTPGRLLQHMDETPGFDCSNLQVLVLDEADRLLDMGFRDTLTAVVANLPRTRQTLLFSATLSKSVKALAALSLQEPEYLAVHSEAKDATPHRLDQSYIVIAAHQKLDVLHSFIRQHPNSKTLVFMSTCKQVKFVHSAFCHLRPGVPLKCLHGKMKQMKRLASYAEFCDTKAVVMFATDIAARGLDFPTVDWVIQVDCPEDAATYIHRVGRTARFTASGKSLLMLLPSEEKGMAEVLAEARVPVKKIKINPEKQGRPIAPALQALLSRDVEIKEDAKRAVVSYVRSVHLQPDKRVFQAAQLQVADYALSLGLPSAPRLRFLQSKGGPPDGDSEGEAEDDLPSEEEEEDQDEASRNRKRALLLGGSAGARDADDDDDDDEDEEEDSDEEEEEEEEEEGSDDSDLDGGFQLKQRNHRLQGEAQEPGSDDDDDDEEEEDEESEEDEGGSGEDDDDSSDDGGFVVKKKLNVGGAEEESDEDDDGAPVEMSSLRSKEKKKKKMKIRDGTANLSAGNTRVVFDEEGAAQAPLSQLASEQEADLRDEELREEARVRFAAAREEMKERDKADRQREKARLRALRQDTKRKMKEAMAGVDGGAVAVLGRAHDDDDDGDAHMENDSGSEEQSDDDGRGARDGGGPDSGEDGSSSDDEDEEPDRRPARGKRKNDAAGKDAKRARVDDVKSMEQMALDMIRNRK